MASNWVANKFAQYSDRLSSHLSLPLKLIDITHIWYVCMQPTQSAIC